MLWKFSTASAGSGSGVANACCAGRKMCVRRCSSWAVWSGERTRGSRIRPGREIFATGREEESLVALSLEEEEDAGGGEGENWMS